MTGHEHCRDSKLHGATPLHLACARVAALLPDDATDIVELLCSKRSLERCFGSFTDISYHPEQVIACSRSAMLQL
jgi:hypothetical protein